jgi:hypothetical protein
VETKTVEGLVALRSGLKDKAWQGVPMLVFRMHGQRLPPPPDLDGDSRAFQFPRPRGRSCEARIAVVALTAAKADRSEETTRRRCDGIAA